MSLRLIRRNLRIRVYSALNSWPKDSTYRDRITTRPGISNFATGGTTTAGAGPIRLLAEVNYSTVEETARYLVASSNGALYKLSTASGGWTAISSSLTVSSSNPIQGAPFGNKLFIADWEATTASTGGINNGVLGKLNRHSISGEIKTSGTRFDDVGLDWTTVCAAGDILVITSGNSKGSYIISAVTAAELTLPTTLSDETGLRYYIIDDPTMAQVVDTFIAPGVTDFGAGIGVSHVLSIISPDHLGPKFYRITAVVAGRDSLTVVELDGTSLAAQDGTIAARWNICRSAKVLDLEAGTLSIWEATAGRGSVPHGAKMVITWQDRMVMANDQINPHVWSMSRNGDPYDWLYGSEDLGSPVAGTNFQAGLIGEPLTALIAHNKSCLLFGAEDSIWLMRGDPMQGGYIERLSDDIGVVGPFAHTKTDKDATYFISHVGLYVMPSGCGDVPTPVSRDKIPAHGPVDWGSNDKHLAFDVVHNGLMLLYLETATHTFKSIWFDLKHGGFWPLSFSPKQHSRLFHWQPAAGRDGQKALGSLMFGGPSGEVSQLDGSANGDYGSSTAVSSSVVVGPIKVSGSQAQSAMVQEIQTVGEFSSSSGVVNMVVRVGPTAKVASTIIPGPGAGAVNLAPWTAGSVLTATTENPRVSGHALTLQILASAGHTDWAFDEACLTIAPLGKAR